VASAAPSLAWVAEVRVRSSALTLERMSAP